MDEAWARIFGSNSALGWPSGAMSGDLGSNKLTPYPNDDGSNDRNLANVTVYSQVEVRASLRQDSEAIRKLCRSAHVSVPEDARSVSTLAF